MATNSFEPIPANATGPPPPPTKAAGGVDPRDAPGGYIPDRSNNNNNSNNSGVGAGGGLGPVITGPIPTGTIAPDPVEPNYDADQWQSIHYAARRANSSPWELARCIQSQNIDVHTSVTQYTALHIAVKFGQSEGVRELIGARARIDSQDVLGQTALSLACCYDVGTDIVRQLIDAEANKEHEDKYTWRPIFWAASKGYYDVVKLLVDRGTSTQQRDKRGRRPYDVTSDTRILALLA